jgi:hypothetical protein
MIKALQSSSRKEVKKSSPNEMDNLTQCLSSIHLPNDPSILKLNNNQNENDHDNQLLLNELKKVSDERDMLAKRLQTHQTMTNDRLEEVTNEYSIVKKTLQDQLSTCRNDIENRDLQLKEFERQLEESYKAQNEIKK